ncbi:gamma-glutamyl-gamma-aminobutyrate hydrolase family protein [Actinophytocola gossypii]|uniref:Gamma-glutamyl-gamma-aminobutyrate hydrolase family protein n=1 Tax=Actinophytocola gossypii TaxID=2812003 RepID=A0ABT2J9L1_9PSEU|nr:gamma-glutamyl-gamma-aminobutyrate hydrolase family protein [Actinophytocola gossypii]MCT2584552.1 gamma-glutamyl-gamma-aminobutyrate hydrolase family protein [Actinophytocola gossypii]
MTRPLVAIPARFSASASALRFRAEVAARALVEAVFLAGGEPWVLHPDTTDVDDRLARCDGLLLPGGGDLAPHTYTAGDVHASVYDVDEEQDAFDLAAARYALEAGLPTLAICRGLHVVNVALGGSLHQDMTSPHQHVVHPVALHPDSALAAIRRADKVEASCFHHQCVDRLAEGLRPVAWAVDGTVEAVERTAPGWFVAVQWHPEDNPDQWLFDAFVSAAR